MNVSRGLPCQQLAKRDPFPRTSLSLLSMHLLRDIRMAQKVADFNG
jgi:hypothetical protein